MKTIKKHCGVIVPMITPFTKEKSIDIEATEKILESFLKAGVKPFVLGTTGESVSIADSQKTLLVKTTVNYIKKRTLVYAGISGNCLAESIEQAKKYADMGVDAVVAHLPFYYPILPEQMIRYFEQLAESTPCELILYNIPVTTKQSIPLDVIEKLSYHPAICGIKDSERGIERLDKALDLWKNRTDFVHLMGAAIHSEYALLNGSDGIVPSTGNITPGLYNDLYLAALRGDSQKAGELQTLTNQISEVYQKDRNLSQSIPALKVMMSAFELCKPYVVPPMYETSEQEQKYIVEKTKQLLAN